MTRKNFAFVAVALGLFTGCYPTQYTHIEKVEDGYVLTKNQAGFFRIHGEVWKCVPAGDKAFNCHQAAEK